MFYSGDEDEPPIEGNKSWNVSDLPCSEAPSVEELRNGNPDETCGEVNATITAKHRDLAYETTRPDLIANTSQGNVSYTTYRRQQLQKVSRSRDTSIVLEKSEPVDGPAGYIKQAHITLIGVNGGGRSAISASPGSLSDVSSMIEQELGYSQTPLLISNNGTVLNFADYRIDTSQLPSKQCKTNYDTKKVEKTVQKRRDTDDDGEKELVTEKETETHYLGGTKTCVTYEIRSSANRSLQIGSAPSVTGADDNSTPRAINYRPENAQAEDVVDLTLTYEVNASKIKITKIYSLENIDTPTDPSSGEWVFDRRKENVTGEYTVTASDTRPVSITTNQELNITQYVINRPDGSKTVILKFEGPNSTPGPRLPWVKDPKTITSGDLYNRLLWSSVRFNDSQTGNRSGSRLVGGWRAYSAESDIQAFKHAESGRSKYSFPRIPQTRIYGGASNPRMAVNNSSEQQVDPYVLKYQGMTVSFLWMVAFDGYSTPEQVNLTKARPVIPTRVAVQNAPGNATNVTTIHGRDQPISETHQIEFVRPTIQIENWPPGSRRLVLIARNPKEPEKRLSMKLYLRGADKTVVHTGRDGKAVVHRTGPYVEVRTEGEDWKPLHKDKDYIFGSSTRRMKFNGADYTLQKAVDLIKSLLAILPFAIVYFVFDREKEF